MKDINIKFNLNNFIRASEYFAIIPASSNFYTETIKILESFFASDSVYFVQKNEQLEIFHKTPNNKNCIKKFLSIAGDYIEDVLVSGFLSVEKIQLKECGDTTFIFLPINIFNQTKSVLCIGYFSDSDMDKETLNILLAISTLLGTLLEKQSTENSFEILLKENQRILSVAGEGIMGIDIDGHHTFVNPEAAQLLGYDAKEMLGRESHELWHYKHTDGSNFKKDECKVHSVYTQGVTYSSSEEFFVRKDGPQPI